MSRRVRCADRLGAWYQVFDGCQAEGYGRRRTAGRIGMVWSAQQILRLRILLKQLGHVPNGDHAVFVSHGEPFAVL